MAAAGGGGGATGADAQPAMSRGLSCPRNSKTNSTRSIHVRPARRPPGRRKASGARPSGSHGGRSAAMGGGKDMMGGGAASAFGWDAVLGGRRGRRSHGGARKRPWEFAPMGEPGALTRKAPRLAPLRLSSSGCPDPLFRSDVQRRAKPTVTSVRIRMANPNHGKDKDVATSTPPTSRNSSFLPTACKAGPLTPEITIPGDYAWYAIDQTPEVHVTKGADFKDVFNPTRRRSRFIAGSIA